MKPRFGLDLDGVCYNWVGATTDALNEQFGYDFHPSGNREWDTFKEKIKPEEWQWLWTEGIPDMFGNLENHYPGAPSLMRWLAVNTHLVIMTHRPRTAGTLTMKWLAHYRVNPRELHIMETTTSKTSVPECDFYVDDKIENVEDFLSFTRAKYVFMPRRWWNDSLRDSDIGRLVQYDNPSEIRHYLEDAGV